MRYVYVIGCNGAYSKIGVAVNPEARLAGLQIGCPYKLELHGKIPFYRDRIAFRVERALHIAFNDFRVQNEWFHVTPAAAYMELNDQAEKKYSTHIGDGGWPGITEKANREKGRKPPTPQKVRNLPEERPWPKKVVDYSEGSPAYIKLQERRARRDAKAQAAGLPYHIYQPRKGKRRKVELVPRTGVTAAP